MRRIPGTADAVRQRARLLAIAVVLSLSAALAVNCGGHSPTQPSFPVATTIFGLLPNPIVLGPGDDVAVVGLAAPSQDAIPVDVTGRMRLESSNPGILRVQGTHVIGVAPGETDVRATFESVSSIAHATVFAPSSISTFTMYGTEGATPCWPNDSLSLAVTAILDDGTYIFPTPAWRSSAPAVAPVDGSGRVTCQAPGEAAIEATYQGRTASLKVVVRIPQDAIELRGASRSSLERGRTATIANYGFYVLESGGSGRIVQTIADANGLPLTSATTTIAVQHGSGPWRTETTFVVPATATSVCAHVVLYIDGSSRTLEVPRIPCDAIQ